MVFEIAMPIAVLTHIRLALWTLVVHGSSFLHFPMLDSQFMFFPNPIDHMTALFTIERLSAHRFTRE